MEKYMRLRLFCAIGIGVLIATGAVAQPIAPTRTYGPKLPTFQPPQGIQLLPKTPQEGIAAEGMGVQTPKSPGLLPLKPLQPFVARQNMPALTKSARTAEEIEDDPDMKDQRMYKSGYGLSWYDAAPATPADTQPIK
jgi:hypothetical protein